MWFADKETPDTGATTMVEDARTDEQVLHGAGDDLLEPALSDEDILDAMRRIPGYLDISTADFREIYQLAHRHALERLFGGVTAGALMRTGIEPARVDMTLGEAAASMARQGLKTVPVDDARGHVVGMLSESDYLRRLNAHTFLELLLRLVRDVNSFSHRCRETRVSEAMTSPPATLTEDTGFFGMIRAFRNHDVRTMPVVDEQGRLKGVLFRKDFVRAHHLEEFL